MNKKPSFGMLVLCLILDLIGMLSYAIPVLGEFLDILWAPIYGLIIQVMFGDGIYTSIAIFEEIFPGLDIIPSATIFWLIRRFSK